MTSSIYIPRGVNVKSLSTSTLWPFQPTKPFKVVNLKVSFIISLTLCHRYYYHKYLGTRNNDFLNMTIFYLIIIYYTESACAGW